MKEFGTLYIFELKKILGQRLVLVSLLLGAAMIFGWNLLTFSSTGYYYNVYNAQDGTVERQIGNYGAVEAMGRDYLRGLSGQLLDDALMEQLAAGYADSDTGTILSNLDGYSPFSYLNTMLGQEVTAQRFYRDKVRRFEVNQEECLLTDQEVAYWQGKASSLGPFTLDYAGGWQAMAQDSGLLCQVAVLLSAMCLCRLFSEEHRTRTDQLVLTSAKGKTTAFWARWAAGCSFAAGLTLVLSGVYILVYGGFYGLDGFSTALQLWSGGTLPLHLSMGGFVLVLLALLVLGCMAMGGLVMLISELLRSAVLALAVPFLLSGITVLGLFQGQGRLVEQVASYLPFSRISTATLYDYFLVPPFQLNAIEFSVPLYVLLALLFGGLCWLCYRKYQVTGR